GAEYSLADQAYATLLARLAAQNFDGTTPQLRDNILAFYTDRSLPIQSREDPAHWARLLTDLGALKSAPLLHVSDPPVPLSN
ncbi:MAG TPA: hypothetical protein VGL22_06440, partial [Terracidiphilus sp.]